MSKQVIHWGVAVLLLGFVTSPLAAATTFSARATFDCEIGNDPQIGPGSASNTGTGMGARNIGTRRRVSYCAYDVSSLRGPGQVFLNAKLDLLGYDPGSVNVYGVLEPGEHLVAQGMNWNNAPGVKNDPTPTLDTDVVLDAKDLTPILLTFAAPARDVRLTTEVSQALTDFLNSDTDGFVALMFAPEGASRAIIRTIDYGATGGILIQGEVGGQPVAARDPNPTDKATEVYAGAVLNWAPGTYAATHDVYFGTSLADVNAASAEKPGAVSVLLGQDATTYDPAGLLEYGKTYFWRVDEVNGSDGTVYRGNVWSFTTEPALYAVKGIVATASSSETIVKPAQTIDGSGLTGDLHSTGDTTMWVSSKASSQPTWIQYEFDKPYKLGEMWVWNYNNTFETVLGFGFKDVTVEYSTNGADWTVLRDVQFARGSAQNSYAHNTTVAFGGVAARYVRLTAKTNWGGVMQQYGLSEVRFLYTPTYASNPTPAAAQTGVSPDVELQWRPGREAATHQVYFGADKQAVTDGTVPAGTTSQGSFDSGSLDLAKTYYWKVSEVNQAATPSTWPGEVWSFTTSEYLAVDDFESYNNDDNRIYDTWIDGWDVPANGSQVGYAQEPFAERTTVHGGGQAMPLTYDNATAAYSQAECTFTPAQDWTVHGAKTLSLWFYGPAANKGGQLYLKVNGTKVAYTGAAADLAKAQWVQWTVDLASLGVNQKKVTALIVGIEGAGASGVVFIDDVQLRP